MKNLNVKKMFFIDGVGAILSTLFLGVILVYFQKFIGMPTNVLSFLAFFPICFSIYSFSCFFFIKKKLNFFLKGIAVLNLLYACMTISILLFYEHQLSFLGYAYFIVEILILVILIRLELKASEQVIL